MSGDQKKTPINNSDKICSIFRHHFIYVSNMPVLKSSVLLPLLGINYLDYTREDIALG